ncbi:hypothetical protein MMC18_002884 [Xylographa bjoerkii]|nr:hypothetical protein [Xylographa bjoerkii]
MFMITPKATNPSTTQKSLQLPTYQSTSRAARAVRVQKACDRCRLKKIKCDGDMPCLRCGHDKVLCTQSKRTQNDPKAVTREYINSLESRQMNLVKTLQEVLRHAQQPAGEDAMRKIVTTLRSQGDEFESLLTQSTDNRATQKEHNTDRQIDHVEDDRILYDPMDFLVTATPTVRDTHDGPNLEQNTTNSDPIGGSSSFQNPPAPATTGNMEEHWNLNDYWNQVASIVEGPVEQSLSSIPSDLRGEEHGSTLDPSCWEPGLPNLPPKTTGPIANASIELPYSSPAAHESGVATASTLLGTDFQAEPPPEFSMWWDALPDINSNLDDFDPKVLDYVPVS